MHFMKRIAMICFILCLAILLGACAAKTTATQEPLSDEQAAALTEQADTLTGYLQSGDFEAAYSMMNADMQKAMPPATLSEIWQGLEAEMGAFLSADKSGAQAGQTDGYGVVEMPLQYEKGTLIQRTVFDAQGQIAGLFFRPSE